jgi:ABC-type branched-subunit amino acid transport system substrate-binding protein
MRKLVLVVAFVALVGVGSVATGEPRPTHRTAPAAARSGDGVVVVPPGRRVQIAFTAVPAAPFDYYTTRIRRAVDMAIAMHPTIRGFPIQINSIDTLCGDGVDNSGPAHTIVANPQNVAVIGHFCSNGEKSALPTYQAAGIVTISGSASASALPALGPTVFDRTIVVSDAAGDAGDQWLSQVTSLPSVGLWDQYAAAFPPATTTDPFDALYFDATSLLLDRLQQVSVVLDGSLVVDRRALALAVRSTRSYPGVTCTITLDPATGNRVNDQASLARCAS